VAPRPGAVATYWRYCLQVDGRIVRGGPRRMAEALREKGVASAPRYIQKPAFQCEVFQRQRTFGSSRYPFTLARPQALDYNPASFPGAFALLDSILVLPWNERFCEEDIRHLAEVVHWAARVATEGDR
jgi:perosamine synthetase